MSDALELARRFHDAYERLAPSFGYETRQDTKVFDPASANGKLMIAVCADLTTPDTRDALIKELVVALMRTQRFIPSRVIRCNGDKCRKPWCASCCDEDEAEEALEKAEADGDIARAALTRAKEAGYGVTIDAPKGDK